MGVWKVLRRNPGRIRRSGLREFGWDGFQRRLYVGVWKTVQVQHLVADVLDHVNPQELDVLIPPVLVVRGLVVPVLEVELAELACQVHQGDGDDFRLPLEAESGAERVVDEGPAHLNHFLQLGAVPFEALGELDEGGVRVADLKIELDGLKEDPFQCEDFLAWILPECGELLIVGEGADSFLEITNFLGSLFSFTREEESAGGGDVAGEVCESVEHVEPVEVDGAGRYGVVSETKGAAKLLDEASAFSAVPELGFVVADPGLDGGIIAEILLFVEPVRHL